MAKGYEKETRFYIGANKKESEPLFVSWLASLVFDFYLAKLFTSFDEAAKVAKDLKTLHPEYNFVVRSVFVEINSFDLGVLVDA